MNYHEFANEVFEFFTEGLSLIDNPFSYSLQIEYPNKENQRKNDSTKAFVRISLKPVLESQKTLGVNPVYESAGFVFIQVLVPKTETDADYKGRYVASQIKEIFKGAKTQNCVIFRNCVVNELEPETEYYGFKVNCEYEYSSI